MTTPTAPSKYPICRHIKTNGRRCQSPAVHRATFCHFHRTLHDAHTKGFPPPNALGFMPVQHIEKMLSYGEPLAELAKAFPCPSRMTLPPLEDAESVQVAISLIFSDMASGRVEHDRARSLLYALQLASYNFRTLAMVQASQPRQDPMAHRVVRSRQGHTLAAPNDDSDLGLGAPSSATASSSPKVGSNFAPRRPTKPAKRGCPVQAGSPASLLAGVEAPLGQDMVPNSPAPTPGKAASEPHTAPPRRRKIARPEIAHPAVAEPGHPASLPGAAPTVAFQIPDDRIPEDRAEDEPTSEKPAQPQSYEAPWSGYLCDNDVESPSQSVPASPQTVRNAPISTPFTPCQDPEFLSARLQPQPYEAFSRNSNGMTLLASASPAKPNPPLHLRPATAAAGEGVPPQSALAPL